MKRFKKLYKLTTPAGITSSDDGLKMLDLFMESPLKGTRKTFNMIGDGLAVHDSEGTVTIYGRPGFSAFVGLLQQGRRRVRVEMKQEAMGKVIFSLKVAQSGTLLKMGGN